MNPITENDIELIAISYLQGLGYQYLNGIDIGPEGGAGGGRILAAGTPEEIVQDMLGHVLPGVLVVASMVAAIALLQAEGRFTYLTV